MGLMDRVWYGTVLCLWLCMEKSFDFDGCSPGGFVGKRGVFKSGLMPISSLDDSVVTCT